MPLALRSLTKRYGSNAALRGVSLEIHDGEFVTLLGPSGCGKSTLLRIIAGFVTPDSGEVLLGREDLTALPVNRRPVGIVFQNYALFPHMTVEQNVGFGLKMHGSSGSELKDTCERMMQLVGLDEFRDRYPTQLSGGQQQRVALARTLAIEPRVLLLDEPLAALDRKLRVQMQEDLKKLVSRVGITTIFVTHDQEEALNMSDRIALMERGSVIQYCSPMELYDKPVSTFAASFMGNSNLLTGDVRSGSQGTVFEVGGLTIPIAGNPPVRSPATVLIRPESVSLMREGLGPGYPGKITFVTPMGNSTFYQVSLDAGLEIKAAPPRFRQEEVFPVGTRITLALDPQAAYLIPGAQSQ